MAEPWLLHGASVTDTILYVSGEYVHKTEAKFPYMTAAFSMATGVTRAYGYNRIFISACR